MVSRKCNNKIIVEERDTADVNSLAKTKSTLINILQSLKYIILLYDVGSRQCTKRSIVKERDTVDITVSNLKRNLLVIVFAVKKFYKYLHGHHFFLYTNHKPLTFSSSEPKAIPPMASVWIQ